MENNDDLIFIIPGHDRSCMPMGPLAIIDKFECPSYVELWQFPADQRRQRGVWKSNDCPWFRLQVPDLVPLLQSPLNWMLAHWPSRRVVSQCVVEKESSAVKFRLWLADNQLGTDALGLARGATEDGVSQPFDWLEAPKYSPVDSSSTQARCCSSTLLE